MSDIDVVMPEQATLEQRCAWARMHGLDPDIIPLGEPILLDYRRRQIRYRQFETDHAGKILLEGDKPRLRLMVQQLESPPRPFPGGSAGDDDAL